jgi:hypothetical protein
MPKYHGYLLEKCFLCSGVLKNPGNEAVSQYCRNCSISVLFTRAACLEILKLNTEDPTENVMNYQRLLP